MGLVAWDTSERELTCCSKQHKMSVEQSRHCMRRARACNLHGHRASGTVRGNESLHTLCAAASGVAAAQSGGVTSGLRSLAGSALGARHGRFVPEHATHWRVSEQK